MRPGDRANASGRLRPLATRVLREDLRRAVAEEVPRVCATHDPAADVACVRRSTVRPLLRVATDLPVSAYIMSALPRASSASALLRLRQPAAPLHAFSAGDREPAGFCRPVRAAEHEPQNYFRNSGRSSHLSAPGVLMFWAVKTWPGMMVFLGYGFPLSRFAVTMSTSRE